ALPAKRAPVDRQCAKPHSRGRKDGVGQGGRRGHRADFAESARLLFAWHHEDFEWWHFIHANLPIIVEVALLDPPVLEGDAVVKRGRKAEQDAALDLR